MKKVQRKAYAFVLFTGVLSILLLSLGSVSLQNVRAEIVCEPSFYLENMLGGCTYDGFREYYGNPTNKVLGSSSLGTYHSKIPTDREFVLLDLSKDALERYTEEDFSSVWRGTFQFDPGEYRFTMDVDDDAIFSIDSKFIIYDWDKMALGSEAQRGNKTFTTAGGAHLIEVRFYQNLENSFIKISGRRVDDVSSPDSTSLSGDDIPIDINVPFPEIPLPGDDIIIDIDLSPFETSSTPSIDRCQFVGYARFTGCMYLYSSNGKDPPNLNNLGSPIVTGFNTPLVSLTSDVYLLDQGTFIDYNWRSYDIGTSDQKDRVVIRWKGKFPMRKGLYEFSWNVDDGILINVGGSKFGEWKENAGNGKTNVPLPYDGLYDIEVDYYENGGNAKVKLGWKRTGETPGESTGIRQGTVGGAEVGTSSGGIIEIKNPLKKGSLTEIIDEIINLIFRVALVVVPLMIIYGGFLFVTGGGNPDQINRGKRVLMWTIIGLVVIILSKGLVALLQTALGVSE